MGNEKHGLIRGLASREGILNSIIQNVFPEIMASPEGWPLARAATYKGTTVL